MNNGFMDRKPIFAFVLMPFDSKYSDIYKFGIKETASELDIIAERVDEQIYSEGILERIYRQIELADIIIADMSDQNPNVFYEVGYAHGKNKLCIHITSDVNDIPFDLKHKRHIVYQGSIDVLRKKLRSDLEWAKNEIENIRRSQIQLQYKVDGDLKKDDYSAKAVLTFKIDLLNESNNPSAEIESIYFYSTDGWILYQDEKQCPSTDSDIPGIQKRHFLHSPVRRLQKKSWAQLVFKAKKTLAYAFDGEPLRDEYQINGKAILRLITSIGHLDYEIYVNTSVNIYPF